MGTTAFKTFLQGSRTSQVFQISQAVLAGFGIWTTPTKLSTATSQLAKSLSQSSEFSKCTPQIEPVVVNCSPVQTSLSQPKSSPQQPLRVVRFVESDMSAANADRMAGRMVISGRMADVCAELDRLAA